jgi:hypothetical protein
VRDEVIYRCVNHSCARALPRKVNYCPYCGIDQATAAPRPVPPRAGAAWQAETFAPDPVTAAVSPTVSAAAAATTAHPAPPRYADTVGAAAQTAAGQGPAAQGPAAQAAQAAAPPPRPGVSASTAGKAAAPAAAPPPPTTPQRRPVQLRWIALVLVALWVAWLVQRPAGGVRPSRLDARIDKAVAMAQACKANEAQAELIALKDKASTAQLARLHTALDDADQACRKGARGRSAARTGAAPSAGASSSSSARRLLAEARSDFARGDYRAAADKMEVCVTMVDADTKECGAFKAKAERYDAEQRRCLARGAEWVGERCQ